MDLSTVAHLRNQMTLHSQHGPIDHCRPGGQAFTTPRRRRAWPQSWVDGVSAMVNGDSERLQQIANNLLSNAVKFTPPGGKVDVSVKLTGGTADLVVSDSGRGIRQDFLPYVFERFRQEDATATREYGGLGLGLAIARELAALHNGRVQAFSDGAGQGATFVLKLPLLQG
jgi:signal transduction histidine kinase